MYTDTASSQISARYISIENRTMITEYCVRIYYTIFYALILSYYQVIMLSETKHFFKILYFVQNRVYEFDEAGNLF
jgi:hypothetical protein